MKQVIIFAVALSVVGVVQCQDGMELIKIFANCVQQYGGPMDLYQKIMKKEIITDRNSLCTLACVQEQTGVLTAQNTIDINKFKSQITKMGIPSNAITNIVEKCVPAVSTITDKCDIAGALMKCVTENMF